MNTSILFSLRLIIIFLVLVTFVHKPANATTTWTYHQSAENKWYAYSEPMYYIDDDSKMHWHDMWEFYSTIPMSKLNTFGYTVSSGWLVMKVRSKKIDEPVWMQIEYPALDTIDIYVVNEKGELLRSFQCGDAFPYSSRNYKDNLPTFQIFSKGTHDVTVIIKSRSSKSLQIPVKVDYLRNLAQEKHVIDFSHGIYFGFIILAVLFNLFIYFTINEKVYLYYVIYVLALGISLGSVNGYTFEYLWPHYPAINYYAASIATTIAGYSGFYFSSLFLDIKTRSPKLYEYTSILFTLIFGISLLLELISYTYAGFMLTQFCIFLSAIYFYYTSSVAIKQGFKPAWIYLVAFTTFLLLANVYFLKDFGIISYSTFSQHAVQVGSAIEVFLFSIALGTRINYYKDEKNKAIQETFIVQQRALKEFDQFIYRSSHDLRGPLANIMGLVQLLKMGSVVGMSVSENVSLMDKVVHKMDNILHKLMTLSIINQERHKNGDIIICNLVTEEANKTMAKLELTKSNIRFMNYIPSEIVIESDVVLLQIIVVNLLENAFTYRAHRQGGHVINVVGYKTNANVVLEFSDNGPGIPLAQQEKIFEMFYKFGEKSGTGTGLGLYFVKKAVEKLHGSIDITSSDAGSVFRFTLPV